MFSLPSSKCESRSIHIHNHKWGITFPAFIAPKLRSLKSARVILPSGEVRQFRQSVKAAELMLEAPNFFVVNSKSLSINSRFLSLAADEDLEFDNLVMFSIRRSTSVVTAVFLMTASSTPKRITAGNAVRISPEAVAAGSGTTLFAIADSSMENGRSNC